MHSGGHWVICNLEYFDSIAFEAFLVFPERLNIRTLIDV